MRILLIAALLLCAQRAKSTCWRARAATGCRTRCAACGDGRVARGAGPGAEGRGPRLLGPVNSRLRELDKMPNTSARYAEVAIRAAVSAAQEERDEMQLFLERARSVEADGISRRPGGRCRSTSSKASCGWKSTATPRRVTPTRARRIPDQHPMP